MVCCPFHDEKTPSCIISPKTNLFNCFGCGTGGSVIDWVMKTQGLSFRFACEILQKDLGLVVDSGTKATKQNTTTKLTPPLAANTDNQTALRDVINYYHETFKQSPEVHEYLRSRGLDNKALIEQFKLEAWCWNLARNTVWNKKTSALAAVMCASLPAGVTVN